MKRSEVDYNLVTPMMKQYLEIKNKNEDIIVFFRLGDFYEMFFEDAILVSHELELTLTGKNAGLKEKIPMCGIPHHSSTIYINKLIELGYKVGICEQLEDAKNVKGIVKRDIIQVVSKGTNFNTDTIKEYDFNFIGSIVNHKNIFTISYLDITTGSFFIKKLSHNKTTLISEILSLNINELIVGSNLEEIAVILKNQFNISITYFNEIKEMDKYQYIYNELDEELKQGVKLLLTYLDETQKRDLSHLQSCKLIKSNDYLKMNIFTKRNLELSETLRQKTRNNSLIWLLDKTKTAMGSRCLKEMIENPLVDENLINKRYDTVQTLIDEFLLKRELQDNLFEVYDLERLSGKIAFGNANAKDMLQLKNSLSVLPNINEILLQINYPKINTLRNLFELLENSIYENPPVSIKEGYLIKKGYNSELDELKSLRKGGKDFVAQFEILEKEKTGIKNLKIGYNKVFGYYIEVSKGSINLVKDEFGYERRQTLSNCERYISPILKEKEALILNAEEKIVELEYNLFIEIKDEVKKYIKELQNVAKIISDIDVMQSFATLAEENNYIRPIITKDRSIYIKNNRHPVVEKVINTAYVPNDIIMDEKTNILLITGPNMAGKSTYMRQVAITVIMAQIGCFVPADEARLPLFDAIYTRIGASDDLVSGESTFMVEMNDANYAITNATSNSLILFDELGRGTATFDGMALAQSIIEYINEVIKAKTFFSTHYHELTDLEESLDGLKNIHVSAVYENGNLTFLHKIKEGYIDKSYGIQVAKLANINDSIIKRADSILKIYENKEIVVDKKIEQLSLCFPEENEIEKKLKEIDLNYISPKEALDILYDLKSRGEN
ncbi:MAG: DNA mismatch repair protein MutS [Mycoplasmatota bacterium]